MRIVEVEQGSPEWFFGRLGMPTASKFDLLLTPKTRKPSAQRAGYFQQLIAEWRLGQPLEWATSAFMERGTRLEDDARRFYAFDRNRTVERVGLILRDDGLCGGSPDGLVGKFGGLEIKCPGPKQHTAYQLHEEGSSYGESLAEKHRGQCQGYMYLTGRSWWDVISFHPDLDPIVVRLMRDDDYIDDLIRVLDPFIIHLERAKAKREQVLRPWHPEMMAEMEEYNRGAA